MGSAPGKSRAVSTSDMTGVIQVKSRESAARVAFAENDHTRTKDSPLVTMAAHGAVDALRQTLNDGNVNDTNKDGWCLLSIAIHEMRDYVVDLLLRQPSIDINHRGTASKRAPSPLQVACMCHSLPHVHRLLETPGIDVNLRSGPNGDTALYAACCALPKQFHPTAADVVRMVIEHPGVNLNATNEVDATPLHALASKPNYVHLVEEMLRNPTVNVNGPTRTIHSPLMIACLHDAVGVVSVLLTRPDLDVQLSVDPNVGTSAIHEGYTALHMCCVVGATRSASLVLRHPKADVNVASANGETPLHVAVRKARGPAFAELVSVLLLAGAWINTRDEPEPLPKGLFGGKNSAAKHSLDAGPRVGVTPYDVAWERAQSHPDDPNLSTILHLLQTASQNAAQQQSYQQSYSLG